MLARLSTRLLLVTMVLAGLAASGQRSSAQRQTTPPTSSALWDATATQVATLQLAGKHAEALKLLQAFVAKNPTVADAQFMLGSAHRDLANPLTNAAITPASRKAHLDNAVTHFQRALDLSREARMRYAILMMLTSLHDKDDLNQPALAEKFARRMIAEDPSEYMGYAKLSQILLGDVAALQDPARLRAAAEVLRAGRKAAPDLPSMYVLEFATVLVQTVKESASMNRADAQKVLDEARGLFDEMIKSNQEPFRALLGKAMALETYAKRVEPDPKRQAALLEESSRMADQAFKMRSDERRAAMTPAERLEDDYNTLQGRAIELQTTGKRQEGLALLEKFLAANPKYARAHEGVADAYYLFANELKGQANAAAQRRKYLEQARTHYQHAVDLAGDAKEAPFALMSLFMIAGPEELNRPAAERESMARAAIKRFPDAPMAHFQLLRIVLEGSRWTEVEGVLRVAREAIANTPERRQRIGADLHDIVFRSPKLPVDTTKVLLAEGVARLDEALKLKPDFVEALMFKSLLLRLQAERVEKDPARAKALIAEADKLRAKAEALRKA